VVIAVCDLFKIGIGPSSSHTVGPMVAAARLLRDVAIFCQGQPEGGMIAALQVSLHGSLAFTGLGHATDRAIILGLDGHFPSDVHPDDVPVIVARVAAARRVTPLGHGGYRFDPATDLVLNKITPMPGHANGMMFYAFDADGRLLFQTAYYSVGGGFVLSAAAAAGKIRQAITDHRAAGALSFHHAAEMLAMAMESGLSIAAMQRP
jgi:L-serine dehydratase